MNNVDFDALKAKDATKAKKGERDRPDIEALRFNQSVCACTGGLASDYRLECLKLAFRHDDGHDNAIDLAETLFSYVTGKAPDGPPKLYVIENREEPKDSEAAQNRFLSIAGSFLFWETERFAYRFRSFDEASNAVVKFHAAMGGDMTIVPLPLGTELF